MAMGNCRECGKEASSEAKACPHCGATKPVEKTSLFTWIAGGFFALIVGSCVLGGSDSKNSSQPTQASKTPEQIAAEAEAKAREEAAFQKTVRAAAAVKSALRDPGSLSWESIRASSDANVICLEYRAKNGFGGMNKEFVVFANGKPSQTVAAWNKHCTQSLTDMKHAKYALK